MEKQIVRVKGDRFVRAEIKLVDGRLSISGVTGTVGGRRGGEFVGRHEGKTLYGESFGQCVEEIAKFFPELVPALPWHLNDMKAGCEHQDTWPIAEKVELRTFKLRSDVSTERARLSRRASERLEKGETVTYTPEELALAQLPYEVTVPTPGIEPGPQYELTRVESKGLGWLRPDEHPRGCLLKPCEVCGYKYGSAWQRRELPPEIVQLVTELK
jgi:hypothetical protein